jgi:uncharacterized membrane protein YgcG
MAGVMVLLALMLIFSTVVFQSWEEVLRRDNEAEMIFRGEEIVRAIQRYRKDYGTPPAKLEDLLEPGPKGNYYIRQLYKDPLVKDGKWGMLYAGPGGEVIDPNAGHVRLMGDDELDLLGVEEGARARKRSDRAEQRGRTGPGGAPGGGFQPLRDASMGSEVAGGRQYAGLPLAGVKSLCRDDPFRVFKGQKRYQDWLFTWIDLEKPKLPGQEGRPGGRGGRGQGGAFGGAGGIGGGKSGRRDHGRGRGRRR